MSSPAPAPRPRVLVVDDNPAIHEDFRKVLGERSHVLSRLDQVGTELFGEVPVLEAGTGFRVDSAFQGQEALAAVRRALEEGDPFLLAFVDVRMPPGWDGVETLEHLWECDPDLQAVLCTAYSDYGWDDIARRLGKTDSLLILKKPFETVEVLQIAHALTRKWELARQARLCISDLDRLVRIRTAELEAANRQLQSEIEERTRAQAELRGSEERFALAFQASPIPMAIQRCSDLRLLDVNASFCRLSGYSAEALLGEPAIGLHLWQGVTEPPSNALPPRSRVSKLAAPLCRKDGARRETLVSAEPLTLGNTPCLLLIVEDVTEQIRMENQLRQAQKMEVIGRMSAGIAHEFNNILTVIQGNVGLLQTDRVAAAARPALLERVMKASQRAANLTRQLLAFSRQQQLHPRLLDLNELVQRTAKMLGTLVGENHPITLHCAATPAVLLADETGLEQVLFNLAANARDASPDGGPIQIATGTVHLDHGAPLANPEARPGRFVWLEVTDNGCGMPPEVLARIFDPFFTTKEVGKGTGLGLSMTQGIVKQHGGWIEVISQVGRGSSFKVFLPAAPDAAAPAEPAAPAPLEAQPVGANGHTVLVVEDEAPVREMACEVLTASGYRVLEAADGPQALALWETLAKPADLLLTDLVMPNGLTGVDLARALQSRHPGLRIIYTSGYAPAPLGSPSSGQPPGVFLFKPYHPDTLVQAVRNCLADGARATAAPRILTSVPLTAECAPAG